MNSCKSEYFKSLKAGSAIKIAVFSGFLLCAASLPALAQNEASSADAANEPSWRTLIEADNASAEEEEIFDPGEGNSALPNVDVTERGDSLESLQDGGTFVVQGQREATQEQMQESIRKEAFDAAVTGLFPLKPEQIKELLEYYDETTKMVESPPYALPQPEVAVQTISLDPGVAPPTINVAVGHVTTLNILDITGAPWPVHDVSWAGDFEVVEPQEGGHMIRITPMSEFAYGNLSIRLLTLKTPLTFSLRTARDKVHYRMDARVPEYGPYAEASLIDGASELRAGSPLMTSVLDGAPPSDIVRLDVMGVDGRTTAYRSNGMLYIRTPLNLLSPGWTSSVSSADGMNVYALNDTPVVLLSDKGKFTRATITEKKDVFDE